MNARTPPKRRASSQERIERILDATETLLGEQGLGELSMYAIAEQAQIPPSSVYHFFPQIGDVLAALAERVFLELDALLQEQAEVVAASRVARVELDRAAQGGDTARGIGRRGGDRWLLNEVSLVLRRGEGGGRGPVAPHREAPEEGGAE